MPTAKWTNVATEDAVKVEIETLSSILNIVSQLPRPQATRVLVYCMRFIESDKPEIPPDFELAVNEFMKKYKIVS
jgi:hypothetical protein